MSLIESALYTKLSTDSGVSALVGDRIYPLIVAQGALSPSIRYQTVTKSRESAMGSDSGITFARIQIDSFASTYLAAKTVAEAVRGALQRFRGTVIGIEIQSLFIEDMPESYDDKVKMYTVTQDINIGFVEG